MQCGCGADCLFFLIVGQVFLLSVGLFFNYWNVQYGNQGFSVTPSSYMAQSQSNKIVDSWSWGDLMAERRQFGGDSDHPKTRVVRANLRRPLEAMEENDEPSGANPNISDAIRPNKKSRGSDIYLLEKEGKFVIYFLVCVCLVCVTKLSIT